MNPSSLLNNSTVFLSASAIRVAFLYRLMTSVIQNHNEDVFFYRRDILMPKVRVMVDPVLHRALKLLLFGTIQETNKPNLISLYIHTTHNVEMMVARMTVQEHSVLYNDILEIRRIVACPDKEICNRLLHLLDSMKTMLRPQTTIEEKAIAFRINNNEQRLIQFANFSFLTCILRNHIFNDKKRQISFEWSVIGNNIIGNVNIINDP